VVGTVQVPAQRRRRLPHRSHADRRSRRGPVGSNTVRPRAQGTPGRRRVSHDLRQRGGDPRASSSRR
jgi:hypothetical protein